MEEELPPSLPQPDAHPLGSLENPIRVNGVKGKFNYLHRLFTLAREPLFFHQLESRFVEEDYGLAEIYEFIARDNSGRWVLAFAPFFQPDCEEAPEGLWLDPQGPSRGNTMGVYRRIEDFPRGLGKVCKDEDPAKSEFVERLLSRFTPEEWHNQPYQKILVPLLPPIQTSP